MVYDLGDIICTVTLVISFMNSKKDNGPNTDPCGTPKLISLGSDYTPSIDVC